MSSFTSCFLLLKLCCQREGLKQQARYSWLSAEDLASSGVRRLETPQPALSAPTLKNVRLPPAIQPRTFRLLAKLPIEVVFPSQRFLLVIGTAGKGYGWELRGEYEGGYWLVATATSIEAMEEMVYGRGVSFAHRNVGLTIFEKLVRDGVAEKI